MDDLATPIEVLIHPLSWPQSASDEKQQRYTEASEAIEAMRKFETQAFETANNECQAFISYGSIDTRSYENKVGLSMTQL